MRNTPSPLHTHTHTHTHTHRIDTTEAGEDDKEKIFEKLDNMLSATARELVKYERNI